jgi:hypothetical protein
MNRWLLRFFGRPRGSAAGSSPRGLWFGMRARISFRESGPALIGPRSAPAFCRGLCVARRACHAFGPINLLTLVHNHSRFPIEIAAGILPAANQVFRSFHMSDPFPQVLVAREDVFRMTNLVVAIKDAEFPHRCFRCNAPTEDLPMRRKLQWTPPSAQIATLAFGLIGALATQSMRKKGVIHIHLCPRHRKRRSNNLIAAWTITPALLVVAFLGIPLEQPILFVIGFFGFLASAITFLVLNQNFIRVDRIDETYIYLKKVNRNFFASLPDGLGNYDDASPPLAPPPPPRPAPPPAPRRSPPPSGYR